MAERLTVRETFEVGHAPLKIGDPLVRPGVVLPKFERVAHVDAKGLPPSRSGRLKGGPLLRADADRNGGHLRDLVLGFEVGPDIHGDPLLAGVLGAGVGCVDVARIGGKALPEHLVGDLLGLGFGDGRHKTTVVHLSYDCQGVA